MLTRCRSGLLIALIIGLLNACGGGGGSDQSTPPEQQRSGEWNQLVWDQDRWQ